MHHENGIDWRRTNGGMTLRHPYHPWRTCSYICDNRDPFSTCINCGWIGRDNSVMQSSVNLWENKWGIPSKRAGKWGSRNRRNARFTSPCKTVVDPTLSHCPLQCSRYLTVYKKIRWILFCKRIRKIVRIFSHSHSCTSCYIRHRNIRRDMLNKNVLLKGPLGLALFLETRFLIGATRLVIHAQCALHTGTVQD